MIDFIAKLRIGYTSDADSSETQKEIDIVYKVFESLSEMLLFQTYWDSEFSQPDVYYGETNSYIREDILVLYRQVNFLKSVLTLSKMVEGYAEYISLVHGVSISVSYMENLPAGCVFLNPDTYED